MPVIKCALDIREIAVLPTYSVFFLMVAMITIIYSTDSKSAALTDGSATAVQVRCLGSAQGYLNARLSGAINAEINWSKGVACEGSIRPNGGLRLKFSQPGISAHRLALLFGISGIHAGQDGKVLATNVTIMREGNGQFFSTQGDKCVVDNLHQRLMPGSPTRKRTYAVEAHGFCNQPARALNGDGAVLVTRFDFVGRVDVTEEDDPGSTVVAGT
jgi:hypothetical protein